MKKLFTLIELIVVIVVIGILAAIVVPNISNWQTEGRVAAINSNIKNLQTGVDFYSLKNNGNLPSATEIDELTPSPIDYKKLKPDYIRNVPDTGNVKYWVDFKGEVWASEVDSPQIILKKNATGNGVLIEWEEVLGATEYNVYKAKSYKGLNGTLLGQSNKADIGLELIDTVKTPNYSKGEFNVTYLVSSVDIQGFESPPSGLGYLGYEEVSESDKPIPELDTTKGLENLLGQTILSPIDTLKNNTKIVVDERGYTYLFFIKEKNIGLTIIDPKGKVSSDKVVTSEGLDINNMKVELKNGYFYISTYYTNIRIHKVDKEGNLLTTKTISTINTYKHDVEVDGSTGEIYSIYDASYSSSSNRTYLTKDSLKKEIENTGYNDTYGFSVAIDGKGQVFTVTGRRSSNVGEDKIIFTQYDENLNVVLSKYLYRKPNEVEKVESLVDNNDNVYFALTYQNRVDLFKIKNGQVVSELTSIGTVSSSSKLLPKEGGIGFYIIGVNNAFNSNSLIKYEFNENSLIKQTIINETGRFADISTDLIGNMVISPYADGRELIYIKNE